MELNFEAFNLEYSYSCTQDFLEIYEIHPENPSIKNFIGKFCGRSAPINIQTKFLSMSKNPKLLLKLKTNGINNIRADNGNFPKGFKVKFYRARPDIKAYSLFKSGSNKVSSSSYYDNGCGQIVKYSASDKVRVWQSPGFRFDDEPNDSGSNFDNSLPQQNNNYYECRGEIRSADVIVSKGV